MVIQRWQSVFLLLSAIMMGFFCYLPLAQQGEMVFRPYDQVVYLTLNVLIVLLSMISIFLFKNLSRQKVVVKVNLLLIIASAITGGAIVGFNMPNVHILWTSGPLLLI